VAARCLAAALPYVLLFPLALRGSRLPVLLPAAAVLTLGWLYLVRRLGLLRRNEVPLLHESNQGPVRAALRVLASR